MSMHDEIIHTPVKIGSERNFGLVFASVLLIVGVWPFFKGDSLRLWAIIAACVFLLTAFIAPRILHWPNRMWAKFGILLGRIITPIVMGILFLLVIVPIGLILRRRLRRMVAMDDKVSSYWENRSGSVIEPESFEKQF